MSVASEGRHPARARGDSAAGRRPTIAVVYDDGAVSAGEVGVGMASLGEVAFLVPDTPHVALLRPVMEQLGEVHPLSGDPFEDADRVRRLAPDAILTFSELMVRTTAELAASAGVPGLGVETARTLTEKSRQRRVLRDAGVDDVRSYPLRRREELAAALASVGLPAIIKPERGGGSRDTYAVRSRDEARELLPDLFPAVPAGRAFTVEELLQGKPSSPFGDYVSVESLCTPRGVAHFLLTGKYPLLPPFREPGRIWPSHLPHAEQQEVLDLATRALKALGIERGFIHTEIKLTPTGPRIIEVNGRLAGHVNVFTRDVLGIDLVRIAGLLALGEAPEFPAVDFGGRVHFQFNNMAPTEPCRFEGVHGADAVRRVPGVTGYRCFAREGDRLPGGVMTQPLDVIWGSCEDHAAMLETVAKSVAGLSYDFLFGHRARRVPATALRDQ